MKFPHPFFAAVLLAVAVNASASTCDVATRSAVPKFMVSVLLQKVGDEIVMKLANAIAAAATPEEATTRVLREVVKTFPGYVVADTLATPVDTAEACTAPPKAAPARGKYAI
jgi:hypothetical protein